jgi:2-dehydro-3-deoxygluconokinase
MVFCFGEILLRMSPHLAGEWIQNNFLPVYIGGAELNVATALASWKNPVRYCSAMPDNDLTREILQDLRSKNIDTSAFQFSGDRIGIYYLPQGTDLKNAGVIYDRSHSSFASLRPGMIDWDKALTGCTWFHFSAITPALNENAVLICKEALETATAKGLTISIDLNYRSKLWQYGKKPVAVMPELVNYCQVIMGNIWAAESLLGLESSIESSAGLTREQLITAAGKSMRFIHDRFPGATDIAYTFRLDESYFGVLQHGPEMVTSKEYLTQYVVDRVGSGDCFMGGLIHGLANNYNAQSTIDFAAAAAVGKLLEQGDSTKQSIESIKNIINTAWTGMKQ